MHPSSRNLSVTSLVVAGLLALTPRLFAQGCESHHDHESSALRESAGRKVWWRHRDRIPDRFETARLLTLNDFHGNLSAGKFVSGRPVGSAAVLAAYLKEAAGATIPRVCSWKNPGGERRSR